MAYLDQFIGDGYVRAVERAEVMISRAGWRQAAEMNFSVRSRRRRSGYGHRSYRQPKDRVATDQFTRYSRRSPSSVYRGEISKPVVHGLEMLAGGKG